MKTLGIVTQDGVYTNLGLLLSDQCVHTMKAAVFQGTKQTNLTKERGFVTRKEVEIFLGISQSSCGRLLKKMIENGQIVQKGNGKNTHYCLSK